MPQWLWIQFFNDPIWSSTTQSGQVAVIPCNSHITTANFGANPPRPPPNHRASLSKPKLHGSSSSTCKSASDQASNRHVGVS